ncbi:MAG: SDR family oxidoreductase [Pseudomonadota bacterium]
MNRLAGKRVLVTGAAGGIGEATVSRFLQEGANILATDLTGVGWNLDGARFVEGDLSNAVFCDELPTQAYELMGGLDVVINNAGIIRRGDITETSDEDWSTTMTVNVESVFRICRSAIKLMQNSTETNAIVNVSSCWGLYPGPGHVAYCVSKAAVAAMTKCLARDHAADGIRINAVCPNEVNTSMLRSGFEKRGLNPTSAMDELNRSVPLGRIAEPLEIADAIVYLASDEASYVCGACMEINGAKPVY